MLTCSRKFHTTSIPILLKVGLPPARFLPEQGELQQNGQEEDHFELAQAVEAAPVQYGLSKMGRKRDRQQNGSQPEASMSGRETDNGPGNYFFNIITGL